MKIAQAGAYALHALMYMVRHSTELPVTTGTIAKAEGIPPGYLAKIFQRLVKAGIVRSVRGRKRGYVFARPPEEIGLLELFEVIEGINELLAGTSLVVAAWNHPEHRFQSLPESLAAGKNKKAKKTAEPETEVA
ncbi:MAG: RrF2 family transcriptional regulator [Planctomycetota bacterium]|jgi:Rrf2 family protein